MHRRRFLKEAGIGAVGLVLLAPGLADAQQQKVLADGTFKSGSLNGRITVFDGRDRNGVPVNVEFGGKRYAYRASLKDNGNNAAKSTKLLEQGRVRRHCRLP